MITFHEAQEMSSDSIEILLSEKRLKLMELKRSLAFIDVVSEQVNINQMIAEIKGDITLLKRQLFNRGVEIELSNY